ncbi:splicing factor [Dunaliella salina]|uniref:Splicing factor n=1 Tax=Dunaliella salina TaxID=3046 RepID=A0ABQ7GRM2_DUNSA|nr:splicing factor [Dunaliella salina]|eukprot:KAF5837264.1 splicing factor [Dunaliella salina]
MACCRDSRVRADSTSKTVAASTRRLSSRVDAPRMLQVLKERERAKREAEIEAERIARVKEMEATMERLRKQEEGPSQPVRDEGAFPPPPSLDVSGEEAFARRARLGATGFGAGAGQAADGAARAAAEAEESERGMTLAQKMLRKMGWKEGEGLGRNRQGIASPLVMQKTNARAGVIVEGAAAPTSNPQESAPAPTRQEPPEKKPRLGAAITGTPTHVLCLRNMVGPGEVDDELEEEVGVECTKYGAVTDVMIFEVTAPGYPSEEAVRIFVQFERVESATKALVDLQGRYFAGRNVRVAFFPEERFQSEDLAPKAGEFD